MIERIMSWKQSLECAWNACELDNDLFVQQALDIMKEMREVVGEVEMFEKE